jgi:subtilisin
VKVAVLDTGIDYTHEDLVGNYRRGHDFVFDDNDPFDDSFNLHGTHVAGIIGAEENGIGVIGVAPEADLFAVKVLDGAGFGTESRGPGFARAAGGL